MSREDDPSFINVEDSASVVKFGNLHLREPKSSSQVISSNKSTRCWHKYLFVWQMVKRTFIDLKPNEILSRKAAFEPEDIPIGITLKYLYICQV